MSKPRLLDLYCCGGGASYGFEQAGFEVVGVDINKQPNYKGDFIQSDALEYADKYGREFDFIHASPPCQKHSPATMQWRLKGKTYPDLIAPTRDLLRSIGVPYSIENVQGSPLINPIVLCGAMFNIPTYRHRLFETSFFIEQPFHPEHIAKQTKMGRKPKEGEFIQYMGHFSGVKMVQEFTGLHWLGQEELRESIPPQYTKFIGEYVIKHVINPPQQ